MDSSRQHRQRRLRARDPLDIRIDQWLETGRQFVDGVAGNRPGQRKPIALDRNFSSNIQTSVGRWVGEKIDWLLEEDDDWEEPWEQEFQEPPIMTPTVKKPLDAISRRGMQANKVVTEEDDKYIDNNEEWPDESLYKVDRWKRNDLKQNIDSNELQSESKDKSPRINRPLPRSSRYRV